MLNAWKEVTYTCIIDTGAKKVLFMFSPGRKSQGWEEEKLLLGRNRWIQKGKIGDIEVENPINKSLDYLL